MTEYANPRKYAEFNDWPSGSQRVNCIFEVETHPKKGQRFKRTTINPKTGAANAPKLTTYCLEAFIVDGDDGKTYLMEWTAYGFISVMSSDMKHSHESIHNGERFERLKKLLGV